MNITERRQIVHEWDNSKKLTILCDYGQARTRTNLVIKASYIIPIIYSYHEKMHCCNIIIYSIYAKKLVTRLPPFNSITKI